MCYGAVILIELYWDNGTKTIISLVIYETVFFKYCELILKSVDYIFEGIFMWFDFRNLFDEQLNRRWNKPKYLK